MVFWAFLVEFSWTYVWFSGALEGNSKRWSNELEWLQKQLKYMKKASINAIEAFLFLF